MSPQDSGADWSIKGEAVCSKKIRKWGQVAKCLSERLVVEQPMHIGINRARNSVLPWALALCFDVNCICCAIRRQCCKQGLCNDYSELAQGSCVVDWACLPNVLTVSLVIVLCGGCVGAFLCPL